MFLRVNNISLISISFAHLTMFFVVIIMILFTFSFSLMKIFTSNFSQWFCIDDDMLTLNTRWLSNDVINFMLILFAQLSTCFLFFIFMNFFQVCLLSFSISSADSLCADWQLMQWHVDASTFLSSLSNFSSFFRASIRYFYVCWTHRILAACVISSVYFSPWLNSSTR